MSASPARLRLAIDHLQAGRLEQCRRTLLPVLQSSPRDVPAMLLMVSVLTRLGELQQARYYAERAAAAAPDKAQPLTALADVLWRLGQTDDALDAQRRAVALEPRDRNARAQLANFLLRLDLFADVVPVCREVLELDPGDIEYLVGCATALLAMGRPEESVAMLRDAQARDPHSPRVLSTLAPTLNYLPDVDQREILAVHRAYGDTLAAAMPRRPAPPPGPQDPERRLRIAFLSPDMRAHAVAWYLDTLFEYLDRSRFHLTAYYTGGAEDDTSRRLASLVDAWHNVTSLSIPALDQRIRADSIDILLELSGHTRNHRLPLMQLRPAPLQITFQGYPNTTGLSAIDYHIVDSYCNPPGTEAFSVEKLLRIDPVWFCYKPAPGPPPVAPLPSLSRAGTERETVFGSFNALMKLNDRTVAMWTRAVRETPGSRLLIKNLQLQQPQARELTRTRFEAAGVPPDRLEVIGHTGGHADHLATYNRVDLCLDSWPYSGMTTSCEALLMGRPVVTLVGETHAARVGLCILANVGLEDLVAKSEDDYVRLVTALARDPARLAALSTSLRERFLTSPVCDGPGHAARFGAALRQVWRDHCAAPADQR